ncbi:MAG: hypothetical protein A3B89_01780 [Candidatus Buchananbacteria bacterium RIFCSPHIGHO2_02_FULL_40_13]|uniref:CopY family transcriptional regulator n=1 Tax=Candidatus Buchananbacteria bacterium RIFCSPLOWO2_01_FULL_39_33 TaxID=1797543 RepID=A0A1G1YIV6_9BACT|nr:MAG: hypothetical protein A3B89_01780 [Candidatus Buchananbacteria bacterium RIFCSPHIGHO2_02_FULL_40_13]OGY52275.1 MAG: hypothetical protein A3A02_01735 [Candidatus Buchananbacteria bacterium RIFCSPLOWO2_01_FULL_39_33]
MARKKIIHHQVLGELEAEIMEVIWKLKSASVRQVWTKLKKRRQLAYTTVMTVMSRLVLKGILKRQLDGGGAYIYVSAQEKEKFLADSSRKLIKNLIQEFGEVAVAQFIGVVEDSNLKDLIKWQKKLKKIK